MQATPNNPPATASGGRRSYRATEKMASRSAGKNDAEASSGDPMAARITSTEATTITTGSGWRRRKASGTVIAHPATMRIGTEPEPDTKNASRTAQSRERARDHEVGDGRSRGHARNLDGGVHAGNVGQDRADRIGARS